jgi:excisionase family DNA binding protein
MANSPGPDWLTVSQVAEAMDTSTETVRRLIKAGKLPAARAGALPRSPWLINVPAWERQKRRDEIRARHLQRMAGVVVGYSDGGGPADEAFVEDVERKHGPDTAESVKRVMDRGGLFDRLEREMAADPSVQEQLERLNEVDREEAEAQELARRTRRAERIRKRAEEILEDDDE